MNTPRSTLTLSVEQQSQPGETARVTDPHAACRATALPRDRRQDGGFWSKVLKTECCWLWTRSRTGALAYGAFWQNGRIVRAHRVAYELTVGPIPDGLDLLHECDVPHCVRPDHLRPDTHAANQQDMVAKGRNGRTDGEFNPFAKFTWDDIHEMRRRVASGERRQPLAAEFGTTRDYLKHIVSQRVWPESSCPVHREAVA